MKLREICRQIISLVLVLVLLTGCQNNTKKEEQESLETIGYIDSVEDKTYWEAGPVYRDGEYVYSTVPFAGAGEPIISYNIKTGEIKEVVQTDKKDKDGIKYFTEIIVKDEYIYCVGQLDIGWDIKGRTYIYQISLKDNMKKVLACGDNMVLINDRIFYDEKELHKENKNAFTDYTGKKYSMKLDGSDKREQKDIEAQESYSSEILVNGCKYYISEDGTNLYKRDINTKQKEEMLTNEIDERMFYLAYSNDYIQIIGEKHIYITNIYGEGVVEINEYSASDL